MPYNLSLNINDGEGEPIAFATAIIGDQERITDENGKAVFEDLTGSSISLLVEASGYFPTDVTEIIERGDNQLDLVLERDPFGLPVKDACAPGESLLYIDDFQDGAAQGWDAIELNIPGWSVESAPDQPENQVIAAREGASWTWFGGRNNYNFDNVVWRLYFNYSGRGDSHLNYRFVETGEKVARYIIAASRGAASLDRLESGNHVTIRPVGTPRGDEWHLLEIGFFDGTVYVYLDGVLRAEWEDLNPWEGGTLNLEPSPEAEAVFYYDNFSVCELEAPLQTITAVPE